jgi:hypothetical protein
MTKQELELAEILLSYHRMNHALSKADCILGYTKHLIRDS